jgi:hypothetical protein
MLAGMTDFMRPTFELRVSGGVEQTLGRLRGLLDPERDDSAGERIVGQGAGQHMTMTIHRKDRHFWSPWLHLHIHLAEEQEPAEDDVVVWGRFSPHPRVWSAFLLGYVALAAIGMISLGWGLSQWSLDKPPIMLLATGSTVGVGFVMLWSARVGQSLARKQMRHIYQEICSTLGVEPVHIQGGS